MKNIFLSLTFISMISCHINGSFHRAPLKTVAKLYAVRNCSTSSSSLTEQDLLSITRLLKESQDRIIDHIERVTKKTENTGREVLKLSDIYDALEEEEATFLKGKRSIHE